MPEIRNPIPHRVRVRGASSWTVRDDVTCLGASEGAGQVLGEARFVSRYGRERVAGAVGSPADVAPITALRGKLLNVQVQPTPSGDWVDLWTGVGIGEDRIDNGARRGIIRHLANGIGWLLAKYRVTTGWELDADSLATDAVGYMPPFNAVAGGDRSDSTYTVNGLTCYVHNRGDRLHKWTARQVLDYLIASNFGYYDPAAQTLSYGVAWAVDDPQNVLDYELPEVDFNGASCLDAINYLCNQRRGLTFRITVDSATMIATIHVRSGTLTAFSGGGFTLPASTDTTNVYLDGRWIDNVSLTWSDERTADIIEVVGAHPWTAISVAFDATDADRSALEPGWDATEEAAFNGNQFHAVNPWRRWAIRQGWTGWQKESTTVGLANTLEASGPTDALHGHGGLTGNRSYTDANPSVDGRTLSVERDLPCSPDFGDLQTGPRQLPIVFAAYDGTKWADLSGAGPLSVTMMAGGKANAQLQLEIEQNPPAICIGQASVGAMIGDQFKVKTYTNGASSKLVATIGVRESMPLRVSWQRAEADWSRTDPKVLRVELPDCELWAVLDETVTGIDAAGLVTVSGGDIIVRDDRPRMLAHLALLRAFYSQPTATLVWSEGMVIEHAYGAGAPAPGSVIGTATFSDGAATINGVVTRRAWNLTADGFGTAYEVMPIAPEIEAIR